MTGELVVLVRKHFDAEDAFEDAEHEEGQQERACKEAGHPQDRRRL